MSPADPKTWWRGALFSNWSKRLGDYSLFSGTAWNPPGASPQLVAQRRYYGEMIRTMSSLGYYALWDYAPANTLYGFYDETGTIPREYTDIGGGGGPYTLRYIQQGEIYRIGGAQTCGHVSGFAVTTDAGYLALDVDRCYFAPNPDVDAPYAMQSLFNSKIDQKAGLMPSQPAHWPKLESWSSTCAGATRACTA